ncbi:MAG: PASTA domain-containing protein [Oscillospiraceae bacterium]|nr:PASTA domain-containing protein [Oscillospiraceae bacterium]
MTDLTSDKIRKRMWLIFFAVILFVSGALAARIYFLSVVKNEYYRELANNQQFKSLELGAARGNIYDKNGVALAQSQPVWTVIISPNDIREADEVKDYQEKRETKAVIAAKNAGTEPPVGVVYDEAAEIAAALSEILGLDEAELLEKCRKLDSQYVIIAKEVEKPQVDALNKIKSEKSLGTYSVYTVESSRRIYPKGELASQVIGFVNSVGGAYGVESQYDNYLSGVPGRVEMLKDAQGRSMPTGDEERIEPQNGNSIYLTIDETLQYQLEKALAEASKQHLPNNRATGIMMEPSTGRILAMATYPSFDPNPGKYDEITATFSDFELAQWNANKQKEIDSLGLLPSAQSVAEIEQKYNESLPSALLEKQWRNKAIGELYFPGSVFKVITAAAALEENEVDLHTSFYCPGEVTIAGNVFHCWTKNGHNNLDLVGAITKSCNVAFIDIGGRLNVSKFSRYLDAFGFTERTNIDLPGEAYPIYQGEVGMGPVELASSAFGQTNKITPLQMITAYSAAINGGYLMTPYVVEKIVDSNGNIIKVTEPKAKRQVISEETSELMRDILYQVVEANGGANARIMGYSIGGKSGTTQKVDEQFKYGLDEMRYVSSYCAFSPADNPKVILLVAVDDPRGTEYYGSAVAAPVVSAVFGEVFRNLDIYPSYTTEQLQNLDVQVPGTIGKSVLDATTALNAAGLTIEVVGEQSGKAVKCYPAPYSYLAHGGKVYVYFSDIAEETTAVPDVVGMSVQEATKALLDHGLNIRATGGAAENELARATVQSQAVGAVLPKGTTIEVAFIVNDETG